MEYWSSLEGVRENLRRGRDVNAADGFGIRPLHEALYGGEDAPTMVSLLLRAGARPNLRDSDGQTALRRLAGGATGTGTPEAEIARLLIRGGAEVNVRDEHDWTPLHATVAPGLLAVAQLLVEAGANPNAGMAFAAEPEKIPAGKDPSRWSRSPSRERRTSAVTPLHLAGFYLSGLHTSPIEFGEIVLRAGADPQARTKHGSTPIDFARVQFEFNREWRRTVPAAWAVTEYRESWARSDERFPLFERLLASHQSMRP